MKQAAMSDNHKNDNETIYIREAGGGGGDVALATIALTTDNKG